MLIRTINLVVLVWMLPAQASASPAVLEHDFTVDIRRAQGEVRVKDRITVPAGVTELELTARAREVQWSQGNVRERHPGAERRRFTFVPQEAPIELTYSLPLAPLAGGAGSGDTGLVWDGRGPWYVSAPGRMHAFTLTVDAPEPWRVVSQGARLRSEVAGSCRRAVWRETQPQQNIYLIAAPFTEYVQQAGDLEVMAFLRQPDRTLAARYLDLTGRYIGMYERLIGEYPYAKFALVENDRETGYGMPSFTLLGPRVIRLPFIPYTSYPHEILHNWWGNSVYVDYARGNWSEGLTAYLADHRLKAQRGEGAQYRRDALQKYLNFVTTEKDFPLSEFRARHDEASQAVGYHKSLMVFHMLRRRLGDEDFFAALGRFYRDHRFKVASFADLRQSFEDVTGQKLKWFFDQWVGRRGAPELAIKDVAVEPRQGDFNVRGRLRQTQAEPDYKLKVPLRIASESSISRHDLDLDAGELEFELQVDHDPTSLAVDPDFDVFRRLHVDELPASLGAAFGAARLTFIIPRDSTQALRELYDEFVAAWRGAGREVRTIPDDEPLPEDGAVWLLGWSNAKRPVLSKRLQSFEVSFGDDTVRLAGTRLARADATIVLAGRTDDNRPLLWTHQPTAEPTVLAGRLRHYSRVSYVAFESSGPVIRGQWPVRSSPLTVRFR